MRILLGMVALLTCWPAFGEPAHTGDAGAVQAVLDRLSVYQDTLPVSWEYSAGDGAWKPYGLNRGIGGTPARLRATLPALRTYAGAPLAGRTLELRLGCAARGLARVTVKAGDEVIGTLTVDGGDGGTREAAFTLPLPAGRLGQLLEIEAVNEGFRPARTAFWPERRRPLAEEGLSFTLQTARLTVPGLEERAARLESWRASFHCALLLLQPELVRRTFTGKPYDIPDRRPTPAAEIARLTKILAGAAQALNVDALEAGRWEEAEPSLQASLDQAREVAAYVRRFEVGLIGNAHIDIAWLWRMAETVQVARNTYRTVLDNMAEYPELLYAQSQAVTYRWMEEKDPELFARIRKAVQEGRWEIVGGMWVEPDCNLISGESWARQLLFGKTYFREKFGADVQIGWNPDSFGYNWNMPQLYRQAGIRSFITQKLWWNDTTVFPHFLFWWQGVDGTRILTYMPPAPYDSRVGLTDTLRSLGVFEATTGRTDSLILYGLGDHGGGPNREILNRVRGYNRLPMAPRFTHRKPSDYLAGVLAGDTAALPVVGDELYLEYHQGTFTSQAAVKKGNRTSEAMLSTAEKAASVAARLGGDYPADALREAWRTVLTNQFHDILPGSSIAPVYRDALEAYARAQGSLRKATGQALEAVAAGVDTRVQPGRPLLVFNPLSWERTDAVQTALPDSVTGPVHLVDEKGEAVPAEISPDPAGEGRLLVFVAPHVPALGHRVFWLQPGAAEKPAPPAGADGTTLENTRHRLEVDPATGNIRSLKDKRLNREFVAAGEQANRLWVYEDRPEDWDAWNIGYTGRSWMLDKADAVELESVSPVRAVLKVKKSFLGLSKDREYPTENFPSSFFEQRIVLWNDLERIDIRTDADWWEDHLSLKACFPLSVKADEATFEIPFAAIRRTTRQETLWEKARYETPALRWGDLSDAGGGLSLLNDGKYGYDVHGNTVKLSLLRSPTWPDPVADRGRHAFTYSLYTHAGAWNDGETVRRAAELNQPLQAVWTDAHPGPRPPVHAFAAVTGRHAVLETVKRAEDGRGWILRLYDALGTGGPATVSFGGAPRRAFACDLLEQDGAPLPVKDGAVVLEFKPFEIKTVRVLFE